MVGTTTSKKEEKQESPAAIKSCINVTLPSPFLYLEENMIVIFEHVDKLLTFLSSSDIELQLNAAMIFGNMARNGLPRTCFGYSS